MKPLTYLPKGKDSEGVAKTIINLCLPYKNSVKSITMDNGMAFSKHEKVAQKLEKQKPILQILTALGRKDKLNI